MASDAQDPASELERYRSYLRLLVRMLCRQQFQNKIDLSGVVQETLLEAWQAADQFRRLEQNQQAAWLRTILRNNLRDAISKLQTQMRDVGREVSLDVFLEESSIRIEAMLGSGESSPSEQAILNERVLRLADALGQLSPDRREAVELHRLQGLTLDETAKRMDKTKEAVAKLVQRGLADLHQLLEGKVD